MIKRSIEQNVLNAAAQYGVVSITGPRQSGKTTLAKKLFPQHMYVNLENLQELEKIKADPIRFLASVEAGVVVDEVQKYPDLLSYIQVAIDEDFQPGKFILTGSQNLLLLERVSQSLAGRVAVVTLFPFALDELCAVGRDEQEFVSQIRKGFYPAIYDRSLEPSQYYSNYITTYIERDVRTLQQIGDLLQFSRFMQILAGRIGQLLNLSAIGASLGVSHNTIQMWLSVLEVSYIIFFLQPHFNNLGKRVVKTPKVYFVDVGLAASLLRLDTENEIESYYGLGSLFENMVVLDVYKRILNTFSTTKLFFYRDKNAREVDLLVDRGGEIEPVEIKSSMTFTKDFLKGPLYYNNLSGGEKGALIYSGKTSWEVQGVKVLHYKDSSGIEV